jgi:hypothetical protein
MEFKKEVERQREKAKIASESIYGFWLNEKDSTILKIAPTQHGARIKLLNADKEFLLLMSKFCGLPETPKRSNWKGFDLVNNLQKVNHYIFDYGIIKMPRVTRQNYASITSLTKEVIRIYIYHLEVIDKKEHSIPEGSFLFNKIVGYGTHSLNRADTGLSL